ncbi:MAG: hypothetical protein JRG73_18255 [Deltaproteobacteria bacterium]|nr:hypothetical protein [Deltaproteobacteria bacterium]MBW2308869.1 hypothetical protein [Deltaproteobacteria bacterium]
MERSGFPAVLICTLTTVGLSQGVPRVAAGLGIPHPLGKPGVSLTEERRLREERVRKALELLCTEVHRPMLAE